MWGKKKIVAQWKIEFKDLVTSNEAKCPVGVVMWAPWYHSIVAQHILCRM